MARSFLKNVLLATGLLALASCARYTLVEPSATTVDGVIDVHPAMAWSRIAVTMPEDIGAAETWTIDGERLHALMFITGIADGKTLLKPGRGGDKLPKFRAGMPLEEIASLFEATLTTATGSSLFQYRSIEPATVFGQPGLRMEFSFTGQDQLDRDGLAVATVKDGKLYLIAYQGSHLLHYGKYLPEVRKIMQSAALKS